MADEQYAKGGPTPGPDTVLVMLTPPGYVLGHRGIELLAGQQVERLREQLSGTDGRDG